MTGPATPSAVSPVHRAASVGDLLARGFASHQAGQLPAAVDYYTQVLACDPEQPDALHLLGELAHRAGMDERAVDLITRAVRHRPDHAEAHNNLGTAYQALGRLDDAERSYRRALELRPRLTIARNNLGTVLKAKGDPVGARREFEAALALDPHSAEAQLNLGNLRREAGDLAAAEAIYRDLVHAHPANASAWNNLGITLLAQTRLEEGRDALSRAVALDPGSAEAHANLGNAHRELGEFKEAVARYQHALAIRPGYAEPAYNLAVALSGRFMFREALPFLRRALDAKPEFVDALLCLGGCLRNLDHLSEAVDCFDRALARESNNASGHNNRGLTLLEMGRVEEGLAECRHAVALKPNFTRAHSNYLFGLNYRAEISGAELLDEHCRFAPPLPRPVAFRNARDLGRRLRIGYVSPDFKRHSCAFFIEPLLAGHDRNAVEVHCYADVPVADTVTMRLQGLADRWRDISARSDEDLAELLRRDEIDIAVDLAGHTGNNRLCAFARRIAPIQVTWLGYPCTTGVSAIDYRLTDGLADPEGMSDRDYVERLVRLPRTFLAYRPPAEAPPPGPMPALAGGPFTFGSFNNLPKINERVIETWSEILRRAPEARLLLKSRALLDQPTRAWIAASFARCGIDPGRIELVAWIGDPADHLKLYQQVDLALDPFPYNGTTTTCEALWMGVPVLTLAGARHAARVGASLLAQVGLPELIAQTVPDYIGRAAAYATDRQALAAIRSDLRGRMAASPLRDEAGFARDVEAAYRAMWRDWCRS